VTLVSDNADRAYDFDRATRGYAALFTGGWNVEGLYLAELGAGTTQSRIESAVNAGRGLTSYMGHGATGTWANESILSLGRVPFLGNRTRPGIVTAMGCLNGSFQLLDRDALGEALVKSPAGGAMAFWGSTALTEPTPQEEVYREAVRLLVARNAPALGELLIEAQARAWTDGFGENDVVKSWVLLGDPATRVR
jgi:hypothetical protein